MTGSRQQLFDAFRADHALLGSGIHLLGECVRQEDWEGARSTAAKVSKEAGPHIAFEEEDFYPALSDIIEDSEIDEMYDQHEHGRLLIERILSLDDDELSKPAIKDELLATINDVEGHIADCGELFGVMGGLDDIDIDNLLEHLQARRLDSPNWLNRPAKRETST